MYDKLQAYIGDPPKEIGFVADAVDVDYFAKALETRLKYCPGQNVVIIISAESARRIVDALKKSVKDTNVPNNIVRCKDCVECYFASNRIQSEQTFACGKHGIDVTPDWYCADGKRKEGR